MNTIIYNLYTVDFENIQKVVNIFAAYLGYASK